MTTVNTKKSIKSAVVVTYIIATLLLVAVWFVPCFGYGQPDVDGIGNMMMFWYIPAFINAFFFPILKKDLIPASVIGDYTLPGFANFKTQVINGVDIQFPALMVMLLLVITVLALIFIIPVAVGKKDKKTSIICAYIIEGAALFALGILFVLSAWDTNLQTTSKGYLNFICLFAALVVIVCIQSIVEKKSYGAVKVFLFLFSAAAFMFAMFALDNMITTILGSENSSGWHDMLDNLNLSGALVSGLSGFTILQGLVETVRAGGSIWVEGASVTSNLVQVCVIALFIILALNLVIDLIGVISGNKTDANGVIKPHKGGKIFAIVRHFIALAILVIILVCAYVDELLIPGICLYGAILFVLINLIINIARLLRVPSQKRRAATQEKENISLTSEGITDEEEEQTDLIGDEMPVAPYPVYADGELISPVAEPVEESEEPTTTTGEQLAISSIPAYDEPESITEEAPQEPAVYTPAPVLYKGPTDEFMDTLTTEEKIEFSKVFIDKTKGELPAKMPEYEIGGSNDDFFPAVFINLGRFRAMLSSGLLRKIYKHLNSK